MILNAGSNSLSHAATARFGSQRVRDLQATTPRFDSRFRFKVLWDVN